MSGDKRSVATDALETLGMIIPENSGRDAIHLAVEPVFAGQRLSPGQDVGFLADGTAGITDKPLGIVDPFLKQLVAPGERFWLVIYPRQITSLRHVWSHPAFPEAPDAAYVADADDHYVAGPDEAASRKWIEDLAASVDITYSRLMAGAEDWRRSQRDNTWGKYIIGGEEMEGAVVPDEFWTHYEIVMKQEVPEAERGSFFSCSC